MSLALTRAKPASARLHSFSQELLDVARVVFRRSRRALEGDDVGQRADLPSMAHLTMEPSFSEHRATKTGAERCWQDAERSES